MNAVINNPNPSSTHSGWTDEVEAPQEPTANAARLKLERETHKLEKRLCREVGKAMGLSEDVTGALARTVWGGYGREIGEKHVRLVPREP